MERLQLKIEGMSCGHCVSAVRDALAGLEGVQPERVAVGGAVVRYDAAAVTPERIAQAVSDSGYVVHGAEAAP